MCIRDSRYVCARRFENKFHGPERAPCRQHDRSAGTCFRLQYCRFGRSDRWLRYSLSADDAASHPLGTNSRHRPFPMSVPSLGEARFVSSQSHTVSDDVRIPERIEVDAEPGLQFELAGPRAKLFFDAKQTRAGIVTCGGLCPGSVSYTHLTLPTSDLV